MKLLADFYFRAGHLRLTTTAGQDNNSNVNILYSNFFSDSSQLTEKEDAFFQIFTAASLNHKRARFQMAFILENGLIPSREIIEYATGEGHTYHYLRHLVDPESSILFKYLVQPEDGKAYQKLAEFESDTKAQAISNLYLSSQVSSQKMLFDYLKSDEYTKEKKIADPFTDFTANEASMKKMRYLEGQNNEMNRQAAQAQMSLGNRY